ncbi:hypothetical protein [Mycobacterium alsense]|uniref:hypothetical protein n=1 Tax=Mycobacterium alsense TaxID=324058 RepID=UPI001041D1EF|nr:hypothetical protein [Mycobacterium alsense]
MLRDQLKDARRGVDLLLGHLNGTADSLDAALADRDEPAASACADPLVTVATILVRMLRDATNGTIPSALAFTRKHVVGQIHASDVQNVEQFICALISGRRPPAISTGTIIVALIAQNIAIAAAEEIANRNGMHINAVVANLRAKLKSQGDDVQLSDRDAASEAGEEYAADSEMRIARQAAAFKMTNHWNDASNILHAIAAQDATLADDCKTAVEATALMSVTFSALSGGIYQLAEKGNLYPANALLRQLVEAEFILWKFAQDCSNAVAWFNSTPEERRLIWRPATIYRSGDNEYRQKDYAQHCELCGHPTPIGARVAAGIQSFVPMASLFCDQLNHSKDAWQHLIEIIRLIDNTYSTNISPNLGEVDSGVRSTLAEYEAVDYYPFSTAFFSDPIDD